MDTNKTTTTLLQTKQHFEILDGLRAVAALAVVTFHFMEWAYPDPGKKLTLVKALFISPTFINIILRIPQLD